MLGRSRRSDDSPRESAAMPPTPPDSPGCFLVTTLPTEDADATNEGHAHDRVARCGDPARRRLPPARSGAAAPEPRAIGELHPLDQGRSATACRAAYDPAQDVDFRRRLDRGAKLRRDLQDHRIVQAGPRRLSIRVRSRRCCRSSAKSSRRSTAIDFLGSPFQMRVAAALAEADREVNALIFPEGNKGAGRVESRRRTSARSGRRRNRCGSIASPRPGSSGDSSMPRPRSAGWTRRRRPPAAVTFGFDGAQFANSRERVTFEELVHFFALERDGALVRVGAIIQALSTAETGVHAASNSRRC